MTNDKTQNPNEKRREFAPGMMAMSSVRTRLSQDTQKSLPRKSDLHLASPSRSGSRFGYFVSHEVDDFGSHADGVRSSLGNQQNGGVFGNSLGGAHSLAVS
jgi:hypothetical protein